jgi:asparagine synthetase B (glutamine-hydrolysing)
MCNLIVTNILNTESVKNANTTGKLRGPDSENIIILNNILFLHNLLSITGDNIEQPFISNDNKIVVIFNGEIYNHNELYNNISESECIYQVYISGIENIKKLDGEFAIVICDFNLNKIFMIHDTFATKPLYLGLEDKLFCISSYPSVSINLNIKSITKIPPNCCVEFDLNTYNINILFELYTWDLKQYKTNFDDYNTALEKSIIKRTNTNKDILVNMSSGYDTGIICCTLNKLGIKYNTSTILGIENYDIIFKRNNINKPFISKFDTILSLTHNEAEYHKNILLNKTENFIYTTFNRFTQMFDFPLDVHNDLASLGLMKIYTNIPKDIKIVLSGSGADEIMSDYTINGYSASKNTCFMGNFPNDLTTIFPKNVSDKDCIWKNFYYGTQEVYLSKEESTTGAFGLEGRYPFLDKNIVQEFLWLSPELKNSKYKAPLCNYLTLNNYPFVEEKKGFNPFN